MYLSVRFKRLFKSLEDSKLRKTAITKGFIMVHIYMCCDRKAPLILYIYIYKYKSNNNNDDTDSKRHKMTKKRSRRLKGGIKQPHKYSKLP